MSKKTGFEKRRAELAEILGIHPVGRVGDPTERTGVSCKTFKQLREECFVVDVLDINFKQYGRQSLAFVVNRHRGMNKYYEVAAQAKKEPSFSEYGNSLLDSYFKKW